MAVCPFPLPEPQPEETVLKLLCFWAWLGGSVRRSAPEGALPISKVQLCSRGKKRFMVRRLDIGTRTELEGRRDF